MRTLCVISPPTTYRSAARSACSNSRHKAHGSWDLGLGQRHTRAQQSHTTCPTHSTMLVHIRIQHRNIYICVSISSLCKIHTCALAVTALHTKNYETNAEKSGTRKVTQHNPCLQAASFHNVVTSQARFYGDFPRDNMSCTMYNNIRVVCVLVCVAWVRACVCSRARECVCMCVLCGCVYEFVCGCV